MLNRRDLLKGVSLGAGGWLLSPMLSRLHAEANGALAGVKRFVFVVEGNGVPWQQIQPKGVSRKDVASGSYTGRSGKIREGLIEKPLADLELPAALEPVKEFKDRLTILQGLSGKMNGGGHSNDFGALGAFNSKGGVGNSGLPAAETIDYALGKKLSNVFPQIGLGIADRAEHTIIYNCSASARGKALPTRS